MAQSMYETEYVSTPITIAQMIWFRRIMEGTDEKQKDATRLYCDNKLAITMAKNSVHHSRTKHIAIKHHFIREVIESGEMKLEFYKSKEQVSNIFTKALPKDKFKLLKEALGVQEHHIKGGMLILIYCRVSLLLFKVN